MFSYWEKESFLYYHHIVIGAGIVGLSTAIELKERFPAHAVLVLERGLMTTGASSRNAGFACMGSLTEVLDDLQVMSEEEVCSLYNLRKAGLERLRNRLGDARIGYAANGSFELIGEKEMTALAQMDKINQMLLPVTGKPAYSIADERIGEFGFDRTYTKALIENTCEGEIHTGNMLRALTDFAISKGVEIKTGADVKDFQEEESSVVVHMQDPFRDEVWPLRCSTVCICTNAFTSSLLKDEVIIPGRGQVLITKPVPGLRFKGVYHFDKGYYYFREIDGRILLGGGRNLEFDAETSTEFVLNERIQKELEEKLRRIIIPGITYTIDQRWAGIMAFGPTKQPVVKAFSPQVFGAFRMGGMGVAMGSEVAYRIAELHTGHYG